MYYKYICAPRTQFFKTFKVVSFFFFAAFLHFFAVPKKLVTKKNSTSLGRKNEKKKIVKSINPSV